MQRSGAFTSYLGATGSDLLYCTDQFQVKKQPHFNLVIGSNTVQQVTDYCFVSVLLHSSKAGVPNSGNQLFKFFFELLMQHNKLFKAGQPMHSFECFQHDHSSTCLCSFLIGPYAMQPQFSSLTPKLSADNLILIEKTLITKNS